MTVRLIHSLPLLTTLLAGSAIPAGTAHAAMLLTTDQTQWSSLVSDVATEDFSDAVLNAGLTFHSTAGGVDGESGAWLDVLKRGSGARAEGSTTFSFNRPINALGGIWDIRPGGEGTHIRVTLLNQGQEIFSGEIADLTSGFWGVLSPEGFTDVRLQSGNRSAVQETYRLDELAYARSARSEPALAATVPLPPSFWLFASGLLGLVALQRRTLARIAVR